MRLRCKNEECDCHEWEKFSGSVPGIVTLRLHYAPGTDDLNPYFLDDDAAAGAMWGAEWKLKDVTCGDCGGAVEEVPQQEATG